VVWPLLLKRGDAVRGVEHPECDTRRRGRSPSCTASSAPFQVGNWVVEHAKGLVVAEPEAPVDAGRQRRRALQDPWCLVRGVPLEVDPDGPVGGRWVPPRATSPDIPSTTTSYGRAWPAVRIR
jgi:hypothetical protein